MADRICSLPECSAPCYVRGYCRLHYARWWRHGDPLKVITNSQRSLPTPAERFAGKYKVADSGCWQWTAGTDPDGYGRFHDGERTRGAHRWSYEHHVGPIPSGFSIEHKCGNPGCVNPAHLEPMEMAENLRRRRRDRMSVSATNRKIEPRTHCKRGHEFTPENTIMINGWRNCRQCKRDRDRAKYQAKIATGWRKRSL